MFNCALYQKNLNLKDWLKKVLPKEKVVFHAVTQFSTLKSLVHSEILDLIVVGKKGNFTAEPGLIKQIKNNTILSLIPLILYQPQADRETILQGYQLGVDEFFTAHWDDNLATAKLKMILKRSQRDLGVNPSTHLPGTNIVERYIDSRIRKGEKFAVCYADLDNFKAYNDYYGYYYGDKLIVMTSKIIRDLVYSWTIESLVGHIGGDDFIFVIPATKIDEVCSKIVKEFDKRVVEHYKKKDFKKGYILTHNRSGIKEAFPIMTLSIAVVVNQKKTFSHVGEISHMIADLKKYTKSLAGSNYVVERRKRY
jgi:diguanylate cyclase (GGDEF)-like protein